MSLTSMGRFFHDFKRALQRGSQKFVGNEQCLFGCQVQGTNGATRWRKLVRGTRVFLQVFETHSRSSL